MCNSQLVTNIMEEASAKPPFLFFKKNIALIDYDRSISYTYETLHQHAACLAHYFVNTLHLVKGSRIGLLARNSPVFFEAFFACNEAGLILTTYNGGLSHSALQKLLESEKPDVLLYDSLHKEKVRILGQTYPWMTLLLFDQDDYSESLEYQSILQGIPEDYYQRSEPEDICMLMHTGGTTGTPKAAKLSYRSIICNCRSQQIAYHLSEKDSTYLTTALFHTAAWISISLPMLMSGAKIVIQRKIEVHQLPEIIEKERLTFVLSVPTVYTRLLELPNLSSYDFSSIKRLRCGAAPLPSSLVLKYLELGLVIYNAYGMTEVGPSNLCFPNGDWTAEKLLAKAGSVGTPMPFNEVRIVDQSGKPVDTDIVGELQFRGPLVYSGYWDSANEDLFVEDGWVTTGDLARKDADNFYYIIGRKKNMYISGGENIFPSEIENIILTHPDIKDCCVVGVPDNEWGEVGKALVAVDEASSLTACDIKEWVHRHMSGIFVPKYVAFLDCIPRNATGKILYKETEKYQTPVSTDYRIFQKSKNNI